MKTGGWLVSWPAGNRSLHSLAAAVLVIAVAGTGCGKPAGRKPAGAAGGPAVRPPTASRRVGAEKRSGPARPAGNVPEPATAEVESSAAAATSGSGKEKLPAAIKPPDDAVERFALFTPGGPLVVELAIMIDGRSFRSLRDEVVDEFVQQADVDGDGRPRWTEVLADKTMSARLPYSRRELADRRQFLERHDSNQNGLVDTDEAGRIVARMNNAGTAFNLDGSSGYGSREREWVLWDMLDSDGDSLLNREELAGATRRLEVRDANDNDTLEADELSARTAGGRMPDQSNLTGLRTPSAAMLGSEGNLYGNASLIMELYLPGGEIREDSFPLLPNLAGKLDDNGDGYLVADEIRGLNEMDPHVGLWVRLGEAPEGEHGLQTRFLAPEVAASVGGAELLTAENPVPSMTIELKGVRLSFVLRDRGGVDVAAAAESQLAALDMDKNGYLEKKEAAAEGSALPAAFDSLDADQDGKLYATEIADHSRRQQAPQQSSVRVNVTSNADPLLALLDVDDDGRLTSRELSSANSRLAQLDSDLDEQLRIDEIPSSIVVTIERGGATQPVAAGPPAVPAPDAQAESGWFVHMDTNRDGEVSYREFLGGAGDFASLDTDGDGFITAGEAGTSGLSNDDEPLW